MSKTAALRDKLLVRNYTLKLWNEDLSSLLPPLCHLLLNVYTLLTINFYMHRLFGYSENYEPSSSEKLTWTHTSLHIPHLLRTGTSNTVVMVLLEKLLRKSPFILKVVLAWLTSYIVIFNYRPDIFLPFFSFPQSHWFALKCHHWCNFSKESSQNREFSPPVQCGQGTGTSVTNHLPLSTFHFVLCK